ncbi:hypothetical protein SAMN04490357_4372 [Streptomyces misionensis]|uniref:Uncharacterized protein n=1 Tax=Streptomyces misionensis TaxID=67331 RepID=A0A1H4ZFG5_9ACTN|nr:hypothetical protein SAMN04490357_4372 [Streptomyces misionensis]SFY53160.1 hypothetical protein STEPF1_06435 [Streptomyces sp. F-1]
MTPSERGRVDGVARPEDGRSGSRAGSGECGPVGAGGSR